MPNLDFHLYKSSLYSIIFALLALYLGNHYLSSHLDFDVNIIEHTQSIMLMFMAISTYFYAKKQHHNRNKYIFWMWTILWWLMLFGRGISWGRDFFPEVPKIYFRIISILLIAPAIIGTFLPTIRKEIVRRFKTEKIPVWNVILTFVFFGLSDIVEHHRSGVSLLLTSPQYQDLIEELMEIPCILSLMFVVFYLQRNETNKRI